MLTTITFTLGKGKPNNKVVAYDAAAKFSLVGLDPTAETDYYFVMTSPDGATALSERVLIEWTLTTGAVTLNLNNDGVDAIYEDSRSIDYQVLFTVYDGDYDIIGTCRAQMTPGAGPLAGAITLGDQYATQADITALQASIAALTVVNAGTVENDALFWNATTGEFDRKTVAEAQSILGVGAAITVDDTSTIDMDMTDDVITGSVIDASITNAKLDTMAEDTIKGRNSAGTGAPEDLSATIVRGILNVEDGAEANNISDTDADDLTDGGETTLHSHDIDEDAQDAVGNILTDTTTIDFTYDDETPNISAIVIDASITNAKLANMATQTIKGRTTAGTGVPEDLTVTQIRTMINVEDGSEANNISDTNATDLTDGGDTTLHYHIADRNVVAVASLPTSGIVTGQLYRLTATDSTAKASVGIYTYDGTYWWSLYSVLYSLGTAGATVTLPDIYQASWSLTLGEALTLTLPTPVAGATFVLSITDADAYTITWPGNAEWDLGTPGDMVDHTVLTGYCDDGTNWIILISASEVA